ncbi:MAG TPA: MATE family efflux transporter [Ruminococcaceae bacterium]|nr:MATE family efflux transporter [Oscillospiraceae bacterium]
MRIFTNNIAACKTVLCRNIVIIQKALTQQAAKFAEKMRAELYVNTLRLKHRTGTSLCGVLTDLGIKVNIVNNVNKDRTIYKRALKLAVPIMVQNGITNMVGLIDNIMVGSLGSESITAVSIVTQLIFVFNLAIFGGFSGPGIYGAQYYGKGDLEGFRNTVRIKHWIGLAVLIGGILLFFFGGDFLIGLYLKGESEDVDPVLTMGLAKEYLSVMLWGLPFFVAGQIFTSSLRETGNSVKPMISGIVSVFMDILFNYLLIYGNFGFPCLEVKGAAVATVIARVTEALTVIIWAFAAKKKHIFLQGLYRTLLLKGAVVWKLLKKSIPIFFNELLWAAGLAVLTQCYSVRGLDIVAGINISNALCNLFNVVFVALGNAVGILTGQTLGASKYGQAKKDAFKLVRFTAVICVVLAAGLISVSGLFPSFYNTTDAIKGYARDFIIITALFFPIQGILNSLYFTLRSGGKTFITFLFDSVYSWVLPIPCAFLLCNLTSVPILAVYAFIQGADLIKVAIGAVLIRKGIWISNLADDEKILKETAVS